VIPDWSWIITPDAIVVLTRLENGKFLVFRQRKYAVNGISYAPVGGMLEPEEEPLSAAKRELLEEMGCQAGAWIPLGSFIMDASHGVAMIHLFLALKARKVAIPISDDLEDQELLILDRNELSRALFSGKFKEITWSAVVSLALNYLSQGNHDLPEVGK